MRRWIGLLFIINVLWASEPDAASLLDDVMTKMNPENSKATMSQTITTTSGDERTFLYDSETGSKGEFSLMRYVEPTRVKGNAMLMTGFLDNIWMYNARTNRVRRLASNAKKQKFEGSDFTYEDMGSGSTWKTDFDAATLESRKIAGENCYQLRLTPKTGTHSSYSKMILWLRESDHFPVLIDYYDENATFVKSLYLEDIRTVENILTPFTMRMVNHLDQTQTVMKYESITYNVIFPKNYFSEQNLKK